MPIGRCEACGWVGYRKQTDGVAVAEGIGPCLLVASVREQQVLALRTRLRQGIVEPAAPDQHTVRPEMLQHLEECRLRRAELLRRRSPPRTGERCLHVVVEHDRVPQPRLALPVQLRPGQSPLELRVGVLVRLELRLRIQQVPDHIDRHLRHIVLRPGTVMALAQHQHLPPGDAALIPAAHPRTKMHVRQGYCCLTCSMKKSVHLSKSSRHNLRSDRNFSLSSDSINVSEK